MISIERTTYRHLHFQQLVAQLDAEIAERDGADHAFYAQFNTIDMIENALIAYDEHKMAVGCGAIKAFSPGVMEVKRMYVLPDHRGRGIASIILRGLEDWAKELSMEKCVLETGKRQPEAIRLYEKNGYQRTPNYGQYAGIDNSVCFEKLLDF